VNGLDNSGKTPPVTAARKTDLWNVKKTLIMYMFRNSSRSHVLSCYRYTVLGSRFVKVANDWRVVANCKRG